MTVGDGEPEDVSVEENSTVTGDDDDLWAAPTALPPPLAAPAPPLLNTHEREWPAFEHLVMGMARRLDGAFEATCYGKSGQVQHGLDVVAFFAEREPPSRLKSWQNSINELTKTVDALTQLVRSCTRFTRSLAIHIVAAGSLVSVVLLALRH